MCFVVVLGWMLPRATLVLLALFTSWTGCLKPAWLGLLGLLLLPYTTLAYVLVDRLTGSVDTSQFSHLIGLAFGLALDLGSYAGSRRRRD